MSLETKQSELLNFLGFLNSQNYPVKNNFQLTSLLYLIHKFENVPKYEDITRNSEGLLSSKSVNHDLSTLLSNGDVKAKTPYIPYQRDNLTRIMIPINSIFTLGKVLALPSEHLYVAADTLYSKCNGVKADYTIGDFASSILEENYLSNLVSECESVGMKK